MEKHNISIYLSPQTLLWDVLDPEFFTLGSKGIATGSIPKMKEHHCLQQTICPHNKYTNTF